MPEDEGDLYDAVIDAAFQRMISLSYRPHEMFLLRRETRRMLRRAAVHRVWSMALLWVTIPLFPHVWWVDRTTMER
jgi:hypothetical protein